MDYFWFLQQRTAFVRRYFGVARAGFVETMRKIEAKEPPFDDPPYSEDPEPAFFDEWLEARAGAQIVPDQGLRACCRTPRALRPWPGI